MLTTICQQRTCTCKQKLNIQLSYIFVFNLIVKFFNNYIIQSRMAPFSVVPNIYILRRQFTLLGSQIFSFICSFEISFFSIKQFGFQGEKKAFHYRIFPTISFVTDSEGWFLYESRIFANFLLLLDGWKFKTFKFSV